jgi:hypothetical protein
LGVFRTSNEDIRALEEIRIMKSDERGGSVPLIFPILGYGSFEDLILCVLFMGQNLAGIWLELA